MGFSFDSGGSDGPWIAWSARGTQDGEIPAKNFYLRSEAGKNVLNQIATSGIILDIRTMKTGWCYTAGIAGQAPKWVWGTDVSQLPEKPDDDYKKGLQIKCAIGGGEVATWEDSGAGSWMGFADMASQLAAGPGDFDKLPLVRMVDTIAKTFGKGSTVIPKLEVVDWVDRPDCLKSGASKGVDTGETEEQSAPPPQQQSTQSTVPADAGF